MTTVLHSNRRYLAWLISDTTKGLAQALFAFAVPLIALIVTDDPAQAGIIGAVSGGMRVTLMLYGGVLADRRNRIALMIMGSVLGALIALAFLLLALGEALTFTTLLVLTAALAARGGIYDTAGESALKDIVTDDTMGRAQSANQARDAALQLAGGPLGGMLLTGGAWLVAAVMGVLHAIAGFTAWLIPRTRGPRCLPAAPESRSVARTTSMLHDAREGFSWLFSRADTRGSLMVLTTINLGVNTAMVTVTYALQQDGYSPTIIGWVGTGFGVAMLLGALGATFLVSRIGAGAILIAGLIVFTLCTAAVSALRDPIGIVIALGVPGLILPAINAAIGGYFMVATPTELMGRASSAMGIFSMGSMPFAPLIAGFGLALWGRGATILIGAGICAAAAILAITTPALRSIPAEKKWAAHARQFQHPETCTQPNDSGATAIGPTAADQTVRSPGQRDR
ncbi:MFS transporter [Microbacterium sp. YY-01]|uniref:MFS transporter n=1 Tax=Microbacterium sp. YY-01 TaxID=3421634 RepID=UPI003D1626B2